MLHQAANQFLGKGRLDGRVASRGAAAGNVGAGSPALLDQVVLSRATELARDGNYADAEKLLGKLGDGPEAWAAMDLLARIRSQQGQLVAAELLWTELLASDPNNDAYKAALRRVARSRRSGGWASLLRGRGRPSPRPSTPSRHVEGGNHWAKIDVPGVSARDDGKDVVMTFDEGLFAGGGADLDERGRFLLIALGRNLEPLVGFVTIEVVGHTDNTIQLPDHGIRDNAGLGMSRAIAVFKHLVAATKLQAQMFSLRTAGEFGAPYPNDNEQNRSRNQTVSIRVAPRYPVSP